MLRRTHWRLFGFTSNGIEKRRLYRSVTEIKGFISRFKILSPNLPIYLTGGDAIFLGDELKNDIFVDEYLVLNFSF